MEVSLKQTRSGHKKDQTKKQKELDAKIKYCCLNYKSNFKEYFDSLYPNLTKVGKKKLSFNYFKKIIK